MSVRRWVAFAAVITVALLVAAGCSSDDGNGDDAAPTSSSSATDSTAGGGGSQVPVALSGSVNDHGTGAASGDEIELEADDFYFSPTFIEATPGQTLRIEIDNEGSAAHTFTAVEAEVDEEISPGEDATVTVTVPPDGTLAFYCRFHRSQGMQGAIFSRAGTTTSTPSTTG